jgi:hypothetical protein
MAQSGQSLRRIILVAFVTISTPINGASRQQKSVPPDVFAYPLNDDDGNSEQAILHAARIEPKYTFMISKNLVFELQRVIFTGINTSHCSIGKSYREVASGLGFIV